MFQFAGLNEGRKDEREAHARTMLVPAPATPWLAWRPCRCACRRWRTVPERDLGALAAPSSPAALPARSHCSVPPRTGRRTHSCVEAEIADVDRAYRRARPRVDPWSLHGPTPPRPNSIAPLSAATSCCPAQAEGEMERRIVAGRLGLAPSASARGQGGMGGRDGWISMDGVGIVGRRTGY